MRADSDSDVASRLQTQGLIPLQVVTTDQALGRSKKGSGNRVRIDHKGEQGGRNVFHDLANLSIRIRRATKTKDLILFAEHLSIMLHSGITLNKSLALLSELTENKAFSQVVQDVHNQIREGSALWQALQQHPKVFPVVFVHMVRAGEAGGVLDGVLSRLAEYLASVQELKEYLISAMIYPCILGLTALGSIVIMLTVVVPKFAEIFSGMGVDLPIVTQIMLGTGTFLQAHWWVLLLGLALILLGIRSVLNTQGGRLWWDTTKLRLPLVGPIVLKVEIARFSRTLGTLLHSGVTILSAMNIVKGVVVNSFLRQSLDHVYSDLKQGRMLSVSLEKRKVFPTLAVSMLGVGEESGDLSGMLGKIGDMYDKDLKSAIKAFTAIFEPVIILTMGLVVGVMVISMLLAIFSINELGM
ncbi:MAG: type II secretion system F family protein [Desulfovermiculus sp.]|nr:type II secretion system F family protein [Desulfovermiculus sp.]